MLSRVKHNLSSLGLSFLIASRHYLCFSWPLHFVCWILLLPLLVSFQLCLPVGISVFFMKLILFLTLQLKNKAADDAAATVCFLPCHLSLEHLFYTNTLKGSLESRQVSDEDRVLTHSNNHKSFQGVHWKHYTGDMACLDKTILFWTFTTSHLDGICAFWFEKGQVFFLSPPAFFTSVALLLVDRDSYLSHVEFVWISLQKLNNTDR